LDAEATAVNQVHGEPVVAEAPELDGIIDTPEVENGVEEQVLWLTYEEIVYVSIRLSLLMHI
jgi:hypothetical protein